MKEYSEGHPIKADCDHYVADTLELAEFEGRLLCPDCHAYREELED